MESNTFIGAHTLRRTPGRTHDHSPNSALEATFRNPLKAVTFSEMVPQCKMQVDVVYNIALSGHMCYEMDNTYQLLAKVFK